MMTDNDPRRCDGLFALLAPMPHAQNDDLIGFGKKSVPNDIG